MELFRVIGLIKISTLRNTYYFECKILYVACVRARERSNVQIGNVTLAEKNKNIVNITLFVTSRDIYIYNIYRLARSN